MLPLAPIELSATSRRSIDDPHAPAMADKDEAVYRSADYGVYIVGHRF
jgi:hypothetical protein